MSVQVPPVREGRLATTNVPQRVEAGASYEAFFTLTNEGNEAVQFNLETEGDPSWRARLRPESDSLAPQETRRIRVTVEAESVSEVLEHRLTLRARLRPWGTTLTSRARVQVLPRGGAEEDFFSGPTYPGVLSLESFGQPGERGGQIEFEGSGDLTEDGRHSLDLLLRGPNESGTARFGRRSTYQATYSAPSWNVRVGDHTFERTNLTARGQRGVGAEVRYTGDRWQAGAYGLESRLGRSVRQGAFYGGYTLHPRARLSANVLRNAGDLRTGGTLGTLQGVFEPWSTAELQLEGGFGTGEVGQGTAFEAALRGEPSWGGYRIRHLEVEDSYPNRLGDTRRTSASVSARLAHWLSVDGNIRRSLQEFGGKRAFTSNVARAGLQLQGQWYGADWSLRTEGSLERRPLRNEETILTRGNLRAGPIWVRPSVIVGRIQQPGNARDFPFRTYGLNLSLNVGNQELEGSVEMTDAPFSAGFSRSSRLRSTVSSRFEIFDQASLLLRGELRDPGGGADPARNLVGQFRYRLPFGHTLEAEARHRSFGSNDPRVRLTYTVPVGLPTPSFSTDRTSLEGRVVDAQTDTPLSNVRVQLGSAQRLTDETGRFSVPVPDGTSFFRLSNLGRGRVPMRDLPLEIRPEDAPPELLIPVSEAASFTVDVISYEYSTLRAAAAGEDPEPVGGIAGEAITASDGRGTIRRFTGSDGRASFDNLRPGTWNLELAGLQTPENKSPEKSAYEVDIAPGQDTTLTVRVLPSQRPNIQFEEGGELAANQPDEEETEMDAETEPKDMEAAADTVSEDTAPADTPPSAVPFAVGIGPFSGQVGAFEGWQNAVEAADQAEAEGYPVGVTTTDLSGGESSLLYRVWVGQYAERSAADREMERLRTQFPEVLVGQPSVPKGYTVQIGAFRDWNAAVQRGETARQEGYTVTIHPLAWSGETLYRVWVGRYQNQTAVEQERDALAQLIGGAYVVHVGPPGRYTVQLGAFSDRRGARDVAEQVLREEGRAYVQAVERNGGTIYVVRAGSFSSRDDAEARLETLSAYAPDAVVTRTQ